MYSAQIRALIAGPAIQNKIKQELKPLESGFKPKYGIRNPQCGIRNPTPPWRFMALTAAIKKFRPEVCKMKKKKKKKNRKFPNFARTWV